MAVLSLPVRPAASTRPFCFTDLPGEIRDKIYEIVFTVTWFEEEQFNESDHRGLPAEPPKLNCHIESQILRTNRSIKFEAVTSFGRRISSFTAKVMQEALVDIMTTKRLPILRLTSKQFKNFKPHVMAYEIDHSQHNDSLKPPLKLILLYRDLDILCSIIPQNDWVHHRITLVNPYPNGTSNSRSFSCTIQEKLVVPYRENFQAMPNFVVTGAISKELKATTELEVTRPFTDPDQVLRELEDKKAKGNAELAKGNDRKAADHWSEAVAKMDRIGEDREGTMFSKLQAVGGLKFLNRWVRIRFKLNSNRTQSFTKRIRLVAETAESNTLKDANVLLGLNDRSQLIPEPADPYAC
ncbi:uncharacterized protein PAC_14153 [Phialocephala subalpina]|uniref:Uncharacterized protein n=1 Tax=Phialocephala subalpina TaxID=576137 RepID=A0A1L7XGT5_9HELO|nr:uncharacterized protein PAC_14153 [Phialocephala subalpina]